MAAAAAAAWRTPRQALLPPDFGSCDPLGRSVPVETVPTATAGDFFRGQGQYSLLLSPRGSGGGGGGGGGGFELPPINFQSPSAAGQTHRHLSCTPAVLVAAVRPSARRPVNMEADSCACHRRHRVRLPAYICKCSAPHPPCGTPCQ